MDYFGVLRRAKDRTDAIACVGLRLHQTAPDAPQRVRRPVEDVPALVNCIGDCARELAKRRIAADDAGEIGISTHRTVGSRGRGECVSDRTQFDCAERLADLRGFGERRGLDGGHDVEI
ncbi:MAG TPA: hypothetical protein VEW74_01150 [Candidatus Nitrosotalea sp.]|nr:hypothetical protein [Candidatus Nitrosotalea sp.]